MVFNWLLLLSIMFSIFIYIVVCRNFIPLYSFMLSLQNNTPLLRYITFYPFIRGWIFGLFTLLGYVKYGCYEYSCSSFWVDICFFYFLGTCLEVELLGHMLILCLTEEFLDRFPNGCTVLRYHQHCIEDSCVFTPSWTCYYLFDYSHSFENEVVSQCGSDLHFPDG